MKDEIILSGNISDVEINEIQAFLPESNVIKIQTKALSPTELIQLIFQDFSLLSYTMDFILEGLLIGTLTQIKSIIKFFKSQKKPVNIVNIEVEIQNDNNQFMLYISTSPENLELTIKLTNQKMKVICDLAENGNLIQVLLAENGLELEINKI